MKKTLFAILLTCSLIVTGCSGDSAEELFETAELEERQNNPEHAGKLYQEIIEKYPQSDYAKQAVERLAAIKKNQ